MLDDLLVDTVRVSRLQVATPAVGNTPARKAPRDAGGGFVPIYVPDPGPPLACSVQPEAPKRNAEHDKQGAAIDVSIFFSSDPGVGTKDQLVWLTSNGASKQNPATGAYPIITLDGRDIDSAGRNEVWELAGVIRPPR